MTVNLKFADSAEAEWQDRVCSILLSLSMLSDSGKRWMQSNGNMRKVYQCEMQHHYERAVLGTLRLLGVSIHNIGIVTSENVEQIKERGHTGLIDILEQYRDCFNTEE